MSHKSLSIRIVLPLLVAIYISAMATAQEASRPAILANAAALVTYDLLSPNGKIKIKVQTGDRITYDLLP